LRYVKNISHKRDFQDSHIHSKKQRGRSSIGQDKMKKFLNKAVSLEDNLKQQGEQIVILVPYLPFPSKRKDKEDLSSKKGSKTETTGTVKTLTGTLMHNLHRA